MLRLTGSFHSCGNRHCSELGVFTASGTNWASSSLCTVHRSGHSWSESSRVPWQRGTSQPSAAAGAPSRTWARQTASERLLLFAVLLVDVCYTIVHQKLCGLRRSAPTEPQLRLQERQSTARSREAPQTYQRLLWLPGPSGWKNSKMMGQASSTLHAVGWDCDASRVHASSLTRDSERMLRLEPTDATDSPKVSRADTRRANF